MDIDEILSKIDDYNKKIKFLIKKRDELSGKIESLNKREEEIKKELNEEFGIVDIDSLEQEIKKLEEEIIEKTKKLEISIQNIENELNRKFRE
ncbi:MAG: coiled-coil domain-containing protein [Caldisericia bacterium]